MAALPHLRARAITAYFAECDGIDNGIRKIVHAFCNSLPVAQVAAHRMGRAFAVLTEWNSVVTWGNKGAGGDSSAVSAELAGGVHFVIGNCGAFAAVKSDGSVVTWGKEYSGGDSSGVKAELFILQGY